jgi:hypothetical protein
MLSAFLWIGFSYAEHEHSEVAYQHAWSELHNGVEEFENKDHTRVDSLTETHAVEFDFANKWAESIGQALHYQLMTGKRGKVILILEKPKKEMKYYERVKRLSEIYDFDAEYITPKILNIQNGVCPYADCKCHKKNTKARRNKNENRMENDEKITTVNFNRTNDSGVKRPGFEYNK